MKCLRICSSWCCVIIVAMGVATGKAIAQAGDVVVHASTIDITHLSGTEPIDQIDMTASFTNNEFKELRHCEAADSLIAHGVKVGIKQGLCGSATPITNITIPFFRRFSPTSKLGRLRGPDRTKSHSRCGLAYPAKNSGDLWLLFSADRRHQCESCNREA